MGNNAVAWSRNLSTDDGELINVNYPVADRKKYSSKQMETEELKTDELISNKNNTLSVSIFEDISNENNNKNEENINQYNNCKFGTGCLHYKAIQKQKYSRDALYHLESKQHPTEECKHRSECDSYRRLVNRGYRLDDLCHAQIYSHQPRVNHTSNNDWKQLKFVKANQGNAGITKYNKDHNTEATNNGELRNELIKNGYEYVLTPTCGSYKHLSEIVAEKLNHPIHKSFGSPLNIDEMLSIILYTGTDLHKVVRDTEVKQNYEKWKHFRINLSNAIHKLPSITKNNIDGSERTYHGLNKVINHKKYDGWFESCTVISTSLDKNIALKSVKNEGSILYFPLIGHFGPTFENADVSWISKFPYEREVLILPTCSCCVNNLKFESDKLQVYFIATEE
eukprot:229127_1